MAKRKVYRVVTGVELSFSVTVGSQRVLITFGGENTSFSTMNPEIHNRIERRPDFGKLIKLVSTKEVDEQKPPIAREDIVNHDLKENDQVGNRPNNVVVNETSDWQEAKDFLRAEPYNVIYQALTTPEKILAKAEEVGVQFPNLIVISN